MASKLELVSLGGIPHCYNRNVVLKYLVSTYLHAMFLILIKIVSKSAQYCQYFVSKS